MSELNYNVINEEGRKPIKMWTKGVPVEDAALQQLKNTASMPFVFRHVAAMPDVHFGLGATVGSVVATKGAIIPAAVGVDIGCGMAAVRTTLTASQLPDNLHGVREALEKAIPHGRTNNGQKGDRGAWGDLPRHVINYWDNELEEQFKLLAEKEPRLKTANSIVHLGTMGTGNHFLEVCLDEEQRVWLMLHSGSRGIGNTIGQIYIEKAKREMERYFITLPDRDLAYLAQGTESYNDYRKALAWAQKFARTSREIMMSEALVALITLTDKGELPAFHVTEEAVNCHHNYVSEERHFGETVLVTRKGAVRAGEGDLGIIPGSMGAKSFIVRGKGNRESFMSCSHGAGRKMSRTAAKKLFTVEDHIQATAGVECRKDADVIDETPGAYKSIDDVMAAQSDLVDIVHTLKQVVCVKG